VTNISYRPAWVDIDLDAVTTNVSLMAKEFAPAMLCVAVKANGYGHGAVEVAQAALSGGARGLAVALIEEGIELREAGIDSPILLLYQADESIMHEVVNARLTPVLYTSEGLRAFSNAVAQQNLHPQPVHLMLDTGMHREGSAPSTFLEMCKQADADPNVFIEGVSTHFASADERENPFTKTQAARFSQALQAVFKQAPPPFAHCSNSAAALLYPELRMDMVRSGIAVYGIEPSREVPLLPGMRPVMSVRTQVTAVRDIDAGETISYGQRYHLPEPRRVAMLPVGYGDGIPRALTNRGQVLMKGRRFPMAGTVSMDLVMVDCGDDRSIRPGEEVVILGGQGDEMITANDIADLLEGSIGYDVVTRIGPRLPRRYLQGGAAVDLRQQRIDVGSHIPA
jgi:alanine racemase